MARSERAALARAGPGDVSAGSVRVVIECLLSVFDISAAAKTSQNL